VKYFFRGKTHTHIYYIWYGIPWANGFPKPWDGKSPKVK
jgi:hypothetical protein